MPRKSILEKYNEKAFIKTFQQAVDKHNEILLPKVDFKAGGGWFVEAVREYGINEKGQKLRLNKPLLDACALIGDFRVGTVATSGGAQVFKTLIHLQLASALVTIGKHDFAWCYPQANLIPKLVPTGFKPVIGAWEQQFKLERKSKITDSKSMMLHQSTYGIGRFISAANNSASSKELSGVAQANTNVVAFSSDLAIYEERSQYLQKNIDTIRRRFLQGRIASYPERLIGTPGNGAGIELEIAQADYCFISHIDCKECGKPASLSPLGALITPIEIDKSNRPIYFEANGKPRDWWYRDENDKVNTAYFGCEHCGAEISKEQRLNSYFRCTKTGTLLLDLLDSLPYGYSDKRISCGLILSPLIRDTDSSTPQSIILSGLQSTNTQDWQQQELGIATSMSTGGITLESIKRSIGATVPKWQPDYTYFGLDQGRSEHWVMMVNYRLPTHTIGERDYTTIEKYELAHREITLCKAINDSELDRIIMESHGGALDNEPDRSWADKIARAYRGIILFDQVSQRSLNGLMHKPIIVQSGGTKIEAVAIDTHRFQNHILSFFNGSYMVGSDEVPQISIPKSVNYQDLTDKSLVRHLTSSTRDPDRGLWIRPEDKNDDLLKAFVGAELRFYLQVFGGKPTTHGAGIMDMNLDRLL
jgi:hypothetical protein